MNKLKASVILCAAAIFTFGPAVLIAQQISGGGGGGSTSPGGSTTQLQYNNAGAFGGTATLTWDSANTSLITPAGTAANPAIGIGDTDTGFYSVGAGQLSITGNGTEYLRMGFGSFNLFATDFRLFASGSFNTGGGRIDASFNIQTPSTSFSITIADQIYTQIIDPSGTLATGTFVLPAAPANGQIIRIKSTTQITALTISPNSGQSVKGWAAASLMVAGSLIDCQYQTSNTTWYC